MDSFHCQCSAPPPLTSAVSAQIRSQRELMADVQAQHDAQVRPFQEDRMGTGRSHKGHLGSSLGRRLLEPMMSMSLRLKRVQHFPCCWPRLSHQALSPPPQHLPSPIPPACLTLPSLSPLPPCRSGPPWRSTPYFGRWSRSTMHGSARRCLGVGASPKAMGRRRSMPRKAWQPGDNRIWKCCPQMRGVMWDIPCPCHKLCPTSTPADCG